MKTLTEIGREVYGHSGRAINRHSDRIFRDEDGMRYILSRTLDGIPPFFEAYGPFKEDYEGCLPQLRIDGKEYWGDGWTWKKAEVAFCGAIPAVIMRDRKGDPNSKTGTEAKTGRTTATETTAGSETKETD